MALLQILAIYKRKVPEKRAVRMSWLARMASVRSHELNSRAQWYRLRLKEIEHELKDETKVPETHGNYLDCVKSMTKANYLNGTSFLADMGLYKDDLEDIEVTEITKAPKDDESKCESTNDLNVEPNDNIDNDDKEKKEKKNKKKKSSGNKKSECKYCTNKWLALCKEHENWSYYDHESYIITMMPDLEDLLLGESSNTLISSRTSRGKPIDDLEDVKIPLGDRLRMTYASLREYRFGSMQLKFHFPGRQLIVNDMNVDGKRVKTWMEPKMLLGFALPTDGVSHLRKSGYYASVPTDAALSTSGMTDYADWVKVEKYDTRNKEYSNPRPFGGSRTLDAVVGTSYMYASILQECVDCGRDGKGRDSSDHGLEDPTWWTIIKPDGLLENLPNSQVEDTI